MQQPSQDTPKPSSNAGAKISLLKGIADAVKNICSITDDLA
jgi:hypothetical protein